MFAKIAFPVLNGLASFLIALFGGPLLIAVWIILEVLAGRAWLTDLNGWLNRDTLVTRSLWHLQGWPNAAVLLLTAVMLLMVPMANLVDMRVAATVGLMGLLHFIGWIWYGIDTKDNTPIHDD